MKAENLHSWERVEHKMVKFMHGVSLKDKKRSEVLYSLLGIQSAAELVRLCGLSWFEYLER